MLHVIKHGLEQNTKLSMCFFLLDNPLLIVRPPGKSYSVVSFMKCIKPVQNSSNMGIRKCSFRYSFKWEQVVTNGTNS